MSELRRVELVRAEDLLPAQQAELGKTKGLVAIETHCSTPRTTMKSIGNYVDYLRSFVKKQA